MSLKSFIYPWSVNSVTVPIARPEGRPWYSECGVRVLDHASYQSLRTQTNNGNVNGVLHISDVHTVFYKVQESAQIFLKIGVMALGEGRRAGV
jgi:hypothetical protein